MRLPPYRGWAFYCNVATAAINLLGAYLTGSSFSLVAAICFCSLVILIYSQSRRIEPVLIEPWACAPELLQQCPTHAMYFCGCPEPPLRKADAGQLLWRGNPEPGQNLKLILHFGKEES